jgi:polysaccharide pyruvyl transferase WcaK-like protein
MRFHSLIFSAIKHIAFAGLAHEPKIGTICEEFSMPCIALDELERRNPEPEMQAAIARAIPTGKIERHQDAARMNFDDFQTARSI